MLLLLISVNCILISGVSAMMLNQNDINNLEKGKVIQKSLSPQLKKSLKGSESKILINAPLKKVWEVIDKKENFPKFIHQIKDIEVIENKNNQQKVATTVKLCDLLPSFKYILTFDQSEKYKRMKFKKTGGAFKELFGYFEVVPYQGKTILAYRIYSDPGFFIPEFICKKLRCDAIEVMKSIKKEAENN